uniref:Signal recognition particle 14 kDa protein n=1 Tax=Acrobeloides nanus TaxID=290746 RepID=A0A914D9S5_9BILA
MTLLDNDHFLVELNKFFQNSRLDGPKSVSITMKKYNGRTKPLPRNSADLHKIPQEHLCLFRAKLGNDKISTVVHAKEVNKFQLAYAAVLKSNMDSLKKREKEKKPRSSKTTAQ